MPITINGDGTITGLAVGGLPDGCVDADTLAAGAAVPADGSITTAKLANGAATQEKRTYAAGEIVQVLYAQHSGNNNLSTTSDADVATGVTIGPFTPKFVNSNFLISLNGGAWDGGSGVQGITAVYAQYGNNTPTSLGYFDASFSNSTRFQPHSGQMVHNPQADNGYSSGTIRYHLYHRERGGGSTQYTYFFEGGVTGQMIFSAIEIKV